MYDMILLDCVDAGALGIYNAKQLKDRKVFFPHLIPNTSPIATRLHSRDNDYQHSEEPIESTTVGSYIGCIKQVAAGMKHSVFLTNQGHVYACGSNYMNELGTNDFIDSEIPKRVPIRLKTQHKKTTTTTPSSSLDMDHEYIINIASGPHHVVALSNFHNVYTWGLNKNGQCGRDAKYKLGEPPVFEEKWKAANRHHILMSPDWVDINTKAFRLPNGTITDIGNIIDISAGFYSTGKKHLHASPIAIKGFCQCCMIVNRLFMLLVYRLFMLLVYCYLHALQFVIRIKDIHC